MHHQRNPLSYATEALTPGTIALFRAADISLESASSILRTSNDIATVSDLLTHPSIRRHPKEVFEVKKFLEDSTLSRALSYFRDANEVSFEHLLGSAESSSNRRQNTEIGRLLKQLQRLKPYIVFGDQERQVLCLRPADITGSSDPPSGSGLSKQICIADSMWDELALSGLQKKLSCWSSPSDHQQTAT